MDRPVDQIDLIIITIPQGMTPAKNSHKNSLDFDRISVKNKDFQICDSCVC